MKKILVGLAIFIVLVIGSIIVILTVYEDSVRSRAEKEIEKQVDAQVSFNEMSLTLFKGFPNLTVTFHKLIISGNNEFTGDTLALTNELDLTIKTSSLFFGDAIELKSIHLHEPKLYFKVLANGRSNFSIFHSDSLKTRHTFVDSSYVNIALDEVKISNGRIEYDDRSQNIYLLLREVNHIGSGDLKNDLLDASTLTTIGEFNLDYAGLKLFSRKEVEIDLAMQMNVKENTFTIRQNKIRVNHFVLGLEGSFGMLEKGWDLDISFNTQATDFKNIVSLVPGIFMEDFKKIATSGELTFNGFISGQYIPDSGHVPSLLANIKIENGMFKIDTLPDPIENIRLDMTIRNLYGHRDSTIFDIKSFQFDMRKHMVGGRIRIQGLDHYEVDTDVTANIDLAELERMYPISGIEMKGIADFELVAKGHIEFKDNAITSVPAYHLNMKLTDGRFKYESLPAALDSIQFHLVADNKTGNLENSILDFKSLHMTFDQNSVHGFMKVEGYKNLLIKTELKARLDLADMDKLYPVDSFVMRGKLSLDVKAEGVYNKEMKKFPSIDSKFDFVNGFLQKTGVPDSIYNIHWSGEVINLSGKFVDTKLAINWLTYTLEGEPIEVTGVVTDLNHYDYDLKIKAMIDLERLTAFYPINGVTLKGVVNSNIKSKGRLSDIEEGHYEKIISTGKVELKNFRMTTRLMPATIFIESALFTFGPSNVILKSLTGKFGRSNISMSGDLYNYMAFVNKNDGLIKCDLDLKADTLDINEWLAKKVQISKNSGQKNKIYIWQVPVGIEAVFDSEIESVFYEDMKISKLGGEIRIADGILYLHETGFNTLNAKFDISGNYNTRDINHPVFDMDLNIKELDINKAYKEMKLVRDLLPAAGDAEGIFSIDYKLKGELDRDFSPKTETLTGEGEMRIANARINGMKIFEELSKASRKGEVNDPHLKDFVMQSEIRDNKIIVKPFRVIVSGIEADVEGVSEVNGTIRYLMKLELPPLGIKIPFHVTGTYNNPKVAMGKGHVLVLSDSLHD